MKCHNIAKCMTAICVTVGSLLSVTNTAWAFQAQIIPNTGQTITPAAPPGARFEPLNPGLADFPLFVAGGAVTTVVSPDHNTLLILTSGYNRNNSSSGSRVAADSNEYVFVFDISNKIPVQKQVVQVPNTYNGIVFDPSGATFYVSGGVDDNVHIFDLAGGTWTERAGSPIALGHTSGNGNSVPPEAAGIGISADGNTLVVADYYNDSISLLTKVSGAWSKTGELDLRPGKINPANSGVAGGEYPFWVCIKGNSTAYVSSIRDREIDVVNLAGTPSVFARIPVAGQPLKMTLNSDQSALYVAEDQTDSVDVIDTGANIVFETLPAGGPSGYISATAQLLTGHNTNSVTLAPDEKTLYVTNGNTNEVAVVDLVNRNVSGLIPTGWYPNSVSLSADGKYMYVVNGKSPVGPNGNYCHGGVVVSLPASGCSASNEYDLQNIKAGFQSFATPSGAVLARLTQQVVSNNHFERVLTPKQAATLAFVRSKIKHVIFIIKENRTYDQILGDLPVGNGDPSITEFGTETTPNLHNLAQSFVTLDNFYDRSEVSMDGWPWTVSARAPDVVERQTAVNYAGRGVSNDSEGGNRNVNVSLPTLAQRLQSNPLTANDPDVLPGTVDTAAPDGPGNIVNTGYIWDAALRAGLSVRNYGFFMDLSRYNLAASNPANIPEDRTPFADGLTVALPTNNALRPVSDLYFRGYDNSYPDYWREYEWNREFQGYVANGNLPNLSLVRLHHDHMGNYSLAIDGVNTPELQVADNDYAVGLLVQTIANSPYKNDTLVFAIEDDSQDGGDHVDAHRSIAFIAGPYVKQGQVISNRYDTVNFLRTIEEVLGLAPLNLNDALAAPMAAVFDESQSQWSFTAKPSAFLANTSLPIDPSLFAGLKIPKPTHDAKYWADATKGMDFSDADRIDFNEYNHILWTGLMGSKPYPETPTGLDLRSNRAALLARYQQAQDNFISQEAHHETH